MERALDQASLLDTKIPKWFATKDWNYLLSNLDDAYENMVKEFYANAISERDGLKCWVKGKSFSMTPIYLVEILSINPPMFPKPLVYDDLNPNEDLLRYALQDQCFLTIYRIKDAHNDHISPSLSSLKHQIHESR